MEGDSLTTVIQKYETVQDIPNRHAVHFLRLQQPAVALNVKPKQALILNL